MPLKNFTKKVDKTKIKEISENFSEFEINNSNPNISMVFKYKNVTVSLYKTGTILFQGNDIQNAVNIVIGKNEIKQPKKINAFKNIKKNKINANNQQIKLIKQNEIGCDEVGVGDYFGGLTTCAAFIRYDQIEELKKIGVKDSKKISKEKIFEIANAIQQKINYSISHIDPLEYNKLFEKYQNSHIIKTLLHNQALNNLIKEFKIKIADALIIMDQYSTKTNYKKYLNIINPDQKIDIDIFETKADDKYLAVAAASILARDHWLKSIDKLKAKIKEPIFLGASDPRIKQIAKKIYLEKGLNFLTKCVKLHFKTTDEIIKTK